MFFLLQLLSRSLRKTFVPETLFINCYIFTSWYIPCPSGAQSWNSFLFVSCRLAVGHTLSYKQAFSRNYCEVTITREGRWLLAKKCWTAGHTITSVCNETRISRLHGRGWNGWDIRTSFPFFWVLWPPRTQPCITVWKTQRVGIQCESRHTPPCKDAGGAQSPRPGTDPGWLGRPFPLSQQFPSAPSSQLPSRTLLAVLFLGLMGTRSPQPLTPTLCENVYSALLSLCVCVFNA